MAIVGQRGNSSGLENNMIGLMSRIFNGSQNVFPDEVGVILQNLLIRRPGTEQLQNIGDTHSQAPDARASAAFARFNRDPFKQFRIHRS
jgi:hypothetical protein